MNINIWKDLEELKEYFDNFTNLGYLKKTLKNYKKVYGEIEIEKWNSLMGYYKTIYSNNFVSIEEYYKKKKETKSIKNKKERKQKKEKSIKTYKVYIKSHEWNKKRNSFIKRYKNKCQCCKKEFLDKDLSLHHHTYERVGKERDDDLVVVCIVCHNNIHYKNGKKVKLNEKSLRERFEEIKI